MSGKRNVDLVLMSQLATGATAQQAAEAAGCGVRTVFRRLQDENFQRRLNELKAEGLERAVGQLGRYSSAAADTLHQLLSTGSPQIKLGAARAILELGMRMREQLELDERLRRLEDQAAERNVSQFRQAAAEKEGA
jgi:hypothetical protein